MAQRADISPKVTGAIVGAVMKATQGKADPKSINEIIAKKLA